MDYLTLIWTIIQLLLIFTVAAGAICLIIGLFHPITVNLKLRASQLGQRGEVWGSYLFGIVKIGVIATPHNQDVALKILFWQRFLQRNRRQKPTRPQPPPATPGQPATDSASATAPKTTDSAKPQPATEAAAASVKRAETVRAESAVQVKPDSEPAIQTDAEKETEKKSASETAIESETKIENMKTPEAETAGKTEPGIMSESPDGIRGDIMTEDSTEPVIKADGLDSGSDATAQVKVPSSEPAPVTRAQPVDVTPVDVTPLKPVAEVAQEQKAADKSETAATFKSDDQAGHAAEGGSDWRARARRFRRDLNNRYQQLKRYIRLFMRKWQVVWPILQRFWGRGKKGFSLVEPTLKVRYALHEPYITGMFHGSVSIFSGLAAQFGLNFIPVPMFGEPCIYARGHVTAVIRPWRFLAAMLGLLCERDLYREAWQAFRWYRARSHQA